MRGASFVDNYTGDTYSVIQMPFGKPSKKLHIYGKPPNYGWVGHFKTRFFHIINYGKVGKGWVGKEYFSKLKNDPQKEAYCIKINKNTVKYHKLVQ